MNQLVKANIKRVRKGRITTASIRIIAKVVLFRLIPTQINPTFIQIMSDYFIFKSFQVNKQLGFFKLQFFFNMLSYQTRIEFE